MGAFIDCMAKAKNKAIKERGKKNEAENHGKTGHS